MMALIPLSQCAATPDLTLKKDKQWKDEDGLGIWVENFHWKDLVKTKAMRWKTWTPFAAFLPKKGFIFVQITWRLIFKFREGERGRKCELTWRPLQTFPPNQRFSSQAGRAGPATTIGVTTMPLS